MDLRTALGEPPSSFSFARRMRSRLAASTSLRLASRFCASSPRRPRLESMPRTPEGRAASRAARAWLSLRDHSLASRSLTSCPTWESQTKIGTRRRAWRGLDVCIWIRVWSSTPSCGDYVATHPDATVASRRILEAIRRLAQTIGRQNLEPREVVLCAALQVSKLGLGHELRSAGARLNHFTRLEGLKCSAVLAASSAGNPRRIIRAAQLYCDRYICMHFGSKSVSHS